MGTNLSSYKSSMKQIVSFKMNANIKSKVVPLMKEKIRKKITNLKVVKLRITKNESQEKPKSASSLESEDFLPNEIGRSILDVSPFKESYKEKEENVSSHKKL